jgi:DNA repair proteins
MNLWLEILTDAVFRTLLGGMVRDLCVQLGKRVSKRFGKETPRKGRAASTRKSPAHYKRRSPGISALPCYAGRCARHGCMNCGRFVEAEKRPAGRGGKKMKIREAFIGYKEVGKSVRGHPLENARRVVDYMRGAFDERADQEQFWVVLLDAKLCPIARSCLFVGTLDAVTVHPREVLRMALLSAAHSFIGRVRRPG